MKGNTARKVSKVLVCFLLCSFILMGSSGCSRYGENDYNYIIDYMDAIPVVCDGYKLVDNEGSDDDYWDHRFASGMEKTIMIGDTQVDLKRPTDEDGQPERGYIISYGDETVLIDRDFILEKSEEYLTIHQMWHKKDDNSENFKIKSDYYLYVYDDNIFIIDEGGGHGSYMFVPQYRNEIPWTFYRFDLDTKEVQYAGYYFHPFGKVKGKHLYSKVQKVEE